MTDAKFDRGTVQRAAERGHAPSVSRRGFLKGAAAGAAIGAA